MKKLFAVAVLLLAVIPLWAQSSTVLSATFTFDGNTPSSSVTAWNGVPDAYPQDMGAVSLNSAFGGGYGSSIDVPFQLGFLNNGYLADCNPLTWGPKQFTIGDGTHTGDAFTVHGSTTCPYYTGEYGGSSNNLLVGWTVDANYTVVKHTACRYGRCSTWFTNTLRGGTGAVEETQN